MKRIALWVETTLGLSSPDFLISSRLLSILVKWTQGVEIIKCGESGTKKCGVVPPKN